MSSIRKKTWQELISSIRATFRKWGVSQYTITPNEAPNRRDRYHSPAERPVKVEFTLYQKRISLLQDARYKAHENLELMASALESMRLEDVRGTKLLVANAYSQLYPVVKAAPQEPSPTDKDDPYSVLGVKREYPLPIIEAIWKQHLRCAHPDTGGSHDAAIRLNVAMDKIRKERIQ